MIEEQTNQPNRFHLLERLRGFRSTESELQRVIIDSLHHIITNQEAMMATLQDIQAAAEADLAKAQSEQNALTAIQGLLRSQQAKIADLTTQLNTAIANGADPATLQAISDELTQTNTALDANAAAEAALANTTPPADSPATPSSNDTTAPNASPAIDSISPANGAVGDTITITGKNFTAVEAVSFGPSIVQPTAMSVNADGTEVTATVPTGGGTVQVTVSNSAGSSNSVPFTYGSTGQAASEANQPAAAPASQQTPAAA